MMIWIATALGYQRLSDMDIVVNFEYWNYAPNRYRLFHQFLMILHDNPLSIATLISLSFGICVTAAYFIIRPQHRDLQLFLLGVLLVGIFGYGYNAIIYPLLALVGKYKHHSLTPLLLIPLVLCKEFAFFVAVVFLLLYSRNKLSALIYGGLGTVSYLVVRFLILGNVTNSPSSAPLFTPLHMLSKFNLWFLGLNLWFLGIGCCVVILMVIATNKTKEKYLVIVTAIIASLLALWWEPQLWIPTLVLILAERRRSEEQ